MRRLFVVCCALAGIAFSAQAQSGSNSVVRFRLSYGSTFFGNIDVELFDSDKPVTVTNFLSYVQRGAYDRSFINRCIPGFVLQGGEYTVPNPYSSALLEIVQRIPTTPDITNEFYVGTLRSNVFGTLAMAKVDGNPNSANSAWFFNLGNNATNLDVQNGGFTVFGRVKSGLNVLNYFNTVYQDHGYIDQTDLVYGFFCPLPTRLPEMETVGFDTLPVGFLGFDCVHYNDLFTVQMIMLNGPDVIAPKVTVTLPKADDILTEDTVEIKGTASDARGVTSVRVLFNDKAPVIAQGSNSWSVTISNVPPGTNTFTVEAFDPTGNRGVATRKFFRRVQMPLHLSFDPLGGTVTGATNNQMLDLARGYVLTAKVKSGYLFDGWTGTVAWATKTIPFIMESNTALTAIFVTNLFPWVKGTYNGLFYDTNQSQVELETSGFFTLTLGNSGSYTAKILKDGKTYPFRGTFDVDGTTANFVERRGTNELKIRMAVDLTNGTDVLSGTVSNYNRVKIGTIINQTSGEEEDVFTNFIWSADLIADRAVWNSRANKAPLAGKYTALIAADTNSSAGPPGEGFGKVTVSASGIVTLSGTLADTTKATQKVSLSKSNQWPLYVPLHKGKGALLSWVRFDLTQPETDFGGALSWIKQSQSTRYYAAGFTNDTRLDGSLFATANATNRVLDLTNGLVVFSGGELAADFTNKVVLGADSKVANREDSTNKLVLSIQKSTGLMTGSVTPPGQTRLLPFKGAALQKQKRAGGFVPGTNETDRVDFLRE